MADTAPPRLLTRAHLIRHLDGLPWGEVAALMAKGKLPRPVWKLDPADKRARWDRRAVDRALDAESAIPSSVEADERELDHAFGLR